ncbi:hypothetical protein ABPG75_010017 [Micractinium tetrahymenae]
MPHTLIKAPTALDQDILVVVGTHKGTAGKTVAKCGTGFTCKLDGLKWHHHCPNGTLHATGDPPADKVLESFEAKSLVQELQVAEVPAWLAAYQREESIDMRRIKPDSGLLADVLTCQRGMESLSDEEVRRLHYAVAAGNWKLKFVCSHAGKCGCPFELEVRHGSGTGTAAVWQLAPHQFHDPTSPVELAQLRLAPETEARILELLRLDVAPTRIVTVLNNETITARSGGGASGSGSSGSGGNTGSGGISSGGISLFSNASLD